MHVHHGYALGQSWKGLLTDVGVDPAAVLRRAGLPEDLLNRPEARISAENFFRFGEALDTSVNDASFWVRLAEALSPEWFSPPIFAALCSPDLTTAAERLSKFKPLIGPLELLVDEAPDGLHLTFIWKASTGLPASYMHALEAMFLARLARLGTRHPINPIEVVVPTIPRDPTPFETFLGVRLKQGEQLRISFSSTDARRPFLTANGAMWDIFEPELRKRLASLQGNATFEERTRAVLLEALPSGQFAVEAVARRLGVSSRTLQRRLREEGTSYKDVVNTTREGLARQYLRRPHLTSTEIAFLLGFEEPTSFFRAFQRWTGETPERMRQHLLEGAPLRAPDLQPENR